MFSTADSGQLKETLEAIQIPAFAIDVGADGVFQVAGVNRINSSISGLHHEAVTGKDVRDLLPPSDARQVAERYRECIESGRPLQYAEELEMPSGHTSWLTSLIPVKSEDGTIRRLIGNSVGFRVDAKGHREDQMVDDLTYLSAISSISIYKVVQTIRDRLDGPDLTAKERRFYRAFSDLCQTALDASNQMRAQMQPEDGKRADRARSLLRESALERAITDLTKSDS